MEDLPIFMNARLESVPRLVSNSKLEASGRVSEGERHVKFQSSLTRKLLLKQNIRLYAHAVHSRRTVRYSHCRSAAFFRWDWADHLPRFGVPDPSHRPALSPRLVRIVLYGQEDKGRSQ